MDKCLIRGRLDIWKSSQNCKRFFLATDAEIKFYEEGKEATETEVWKSEYIIIYYDEGFFIISNGKIHYRIDEKYLNKAGPTEAEWIDKLVKDGVMRNDKRDFTGVPKCMGELFPYFEGYLQKRNFGYNKRWFVVSEDTITYYKDEATKKERGQMAIRNIVISGDDSDDSGRKFLLWEDIGKKYELMADSVEMTDIWANILLARGAKLVNDLGTLDKIEDYGEFRPELIFPSLTSKTNVSESEKLSGNILSHSTTVAKAILENGADLTLRVLIPGGGLIAMALKGTIAGAAKLMDFFSKPDFDSFAKELDKKIDAKLFYFMLTQLEAEMFATENRYNNMLDKNFTMEQRVMEIPTAMQSFEKVIQLFQNEPLFTTNYFSMAPYLVKLSYFYLAFAKLAVAIHPAYKKGIINVMEKLMESLDNYKKQVVEYRLAAITRHDTVVNALVPVVTMIPVLAYGFTKIIVTGRQPMFTFEKVTDNLYFSDPSQNPRVAYCDSLDDDAYDKFFQDYVNSVKKLYESYFDKIIDSLSQFIISK